MLLKLFNLKLILQFKVFPGRFFYCWLIFSTWHSRHCTWLSVTETCGLPINMYHSQNKWNTHSEKLDLRDTENLALVTLPLGREHIFNDPFERFTIEMGAVFHRIGLCVRPAARPPWRKTKNRASADAWVMPEVSLERITLSAPRCLLWRFFAFGRADPPLTGRRHVRKSSQECPARWSIVQTFNYLRDKLLKFVLGPGRGNPSKWIWWMLIPGGANKSAAQATEAAFFAGCDNFIFDKACNASVNWIWSRVNKCRPGRRAGKCFNYSQYSGLREFAESARVPCDEKTSPRSVRYSQRNLIWLWILLPFWALT